MDNIRNFVIISHIDHGKSTLADRFLELTGTVAKEKLMPQYLDSMSLEREKGITIKMHPVRLSYILNSKSYILNLIDTPGHADFSYEISRALACVEGAVLLVDAAKGVQAQTIFNLEQAQRQNLKLIGAVNKIDLPQAKIEETRKELAVILRVPEEEIFAISGKEGTNVKELLTAIIQMIPCPKAARGAAEVSDGLGGNFRALIFDSRYDSFSGVTAYVRVFEGKIRKGEEIYLMAAKSAGFCKEVGCFTPDLRQTNELSAGEIGYIKTGIKEPLKVRVGDTIISQISKIKSQNCEIKPLDGYQEPKSVLFLSLYPYDSDDFFKLKDALLKFRLNDPALNLQEESQLALGRGFRIGFLGSLHAEITVKRLQSEFGVELVLTSPQVTFKVLTKNNKESEITSPVFWPDPSEIKSIQEPWVLLEIVVPNDYFGFVFKILQNFKITLQATRPLSAKKSFLQAEAPLREIITGKFYDKLKSGTQGYASFSFEQIGFKFADLVKLDVLVAGKKEEGFSKIVPRQAAFQEGRKMVQKLKEVLPAQQFNVALQAAVGGKIIARETIRALRKDVTAPLYGGDVTRKKKLLEIQKKGKKEMQQKGRINIPATAFLQVFKGD